MSDTQTAGASTDVGNTFFWDINSIMQGWVDGNPATADGLIFKATAGSSALNTLGFATETNTTGNQPYIAVYYEQRMGDYPGAHYDSQGLTDRSSVGVNTATDNLLVSNSDVQLTGINGLDVNLGRSYNNLSGNQGSFGVGWSMATGADTVLAIPSDTHNVIDYFDGTGNAQLFYTDASGNFVNPPGEDARVTMNGDGTWASSSFSLLFRHSGITETFTAAADQAPKQARLSSIGDRNGNEITYGYNTSGQLTSIIDSYGNAPGGVASAHTTTIAYSPEGYVSQITDPAGRIYRYFQNTAGQLTQYEDPADNTTNYSYDAFGNLTQITTAGGNITKIGYDAGATNQVTTVTRLVTPTDTTGPQTSYQVATASGTCPANPGWTQGTVDDPNAHVTTYCSDDLARITKSIDANGHSRSTCYSPDGFAGDQVSALGTLTAVSYEPDNNDNVKSIQQGGASTDSCNGTSGGTGTGVSTTFTYGDSVNSFQPTTTTDPQTNETDNTYNSTGNLTKVQDHASTDNTTLTYNANGTVATSKDADGNTTTYSYTNGNLTTVTPPTIPAGSGTPLNPIHLSYDSANRVTEVSSVSGPTGREVDYTYDDFDHLASATYKNAAGTVVATIGYSYDADGNLTTRIDSAGETSANFDGLNRMTFIGYPDGTSTSYGYDPASNLTFLQDAGGEVTYTYNKANQLTGVTDPSGTKEATLAYDADGNRLSTTYPSGASVVDAYNGSDQLTKVTNTYKTSTGTLAHLTFTYAYTGSLVHTLTDQASNVTTYSYDTLNRLTDARTVNGTTTTAEYNYTLDPAGNLKKQAVSGSTVTASTTSYAYNPGNEICWSVASASTNLCNSAPAGAHTYSYDADGNQTSNGNGLTATYNGLGQTTSITSGGTTTNYGYLGEGQTELITEGSSSLHNDMLGLAEKTTGTSSTYYTRNTDGTQVDERTPSGTYNYLYDGNGSVVGLTDSSGHLVNQYAYDPYGNKTTNTGTTPNPFAFQDGYQTTAGLYHFGQRYENPADARWTQSDPAGQVSSLTEGGFAGDDPVNMSDATGEYGTTHAERLAACRAEQYGDPHSPFYTNHQYYDTCQLIYHGHDPYSDSGPREACQDAGLVSALLPGGRIASWLARIIGVSTFLECR
jgi:RHS repeat-associated protein